MEIAAIAILFAFLLRLLLLLIRYLQRDNSYNQNISVHGGRAVGENQWENADSLMYEQRDTEDTVFERPQSRVTSSLLGLYIRLSRPDTGQYWDYYLKHELILGRSGVNSEADIQIADAMVSGRHCRIYRQGEQVLIQDLGSKNHTWLNGCRIEGTMPLTCGDMLKIGESIFQVQYYT